MDEFDFFAEQTDENTRIDLFLTEELPELSRTWIQKLIETDMVLVNSQPINKNYKLKKGDFVTVKVEEPKPLTISPEPIPLVVLYEDNDLIVIDKPKGMVVHPSAGHSEGTLVNALLHHAGGSLSGIGGVIRPGIVHRIDKDTSGILVVAKTNQAHLHLAKQLAEHSMTRCYRAVCFHNLKQDDGTINQPIGRSPQDRKKMAVTTKHAKHAVTHYQVLSRFGKFTLLEARLETGRTHQIRVHMAHIGHPLLGDAVYGIKKQPFHLEGQVLHAQKLGFIHPTTNVYMEFESEPPVYFQALLKKLESM